MPSENNEMHRSTIHQLFSGLDKAYQIVKGFYGPAYSFTTKDFSLKGKGYHILSRIELLDPLERLGVYFAQSLAEQIYNRHTDGVISSVILLRAFLKASLPFIDQGISPRLLTSALASKKEAICAHLQAHSFLLKDTSKVLGLISSHTNDPFIGEVFAQAVAYTGQEGTIALSQKSGSTLRFVQGIQIQRGYQVPSFFPQDAFHENLVIAPKIFVTDQTIHSVFSFLPLLKQFSEEQTPLIIFCKEIDHHPLATCIANRIAGLVDVLVVTIEDPTLLEDIALLTGTTVFSTPPFSNKPPIELPLLGSCTWAELSQDHTLLVCENFVPEVVKLKIRQLDHMIQNAEKELSRQTLKERKHRLEHPIAIIPIEQDKSSLYKLALNTLNTTKKSGFVVGGGAALLYASQNLLSSQDQSQEELAASHILQTACRALLEQLVGSVHMDGKLVANKLCSLGTPSLGFNVLSQQIEDMISAGVIAPLDTVMDIFSSSLHAALDLLLSSYTTPPSPITNDKKT
ncbi:molecular chaperone GroEL [Chlamydia muridarum str. Nigg]|jgi:Chaperonin GroEL (HSP60 family)|uniref:Molecular chaperone GroEL n=2 Tax=Chlamydia muridarum TaxID=83560 RepID=A0A070A048_CHLMR|nr:variant chaperonin GroEL3 [Chlamydia muridarum]AAF39014.1 60 kDa chaperonin, putative [Chlamydia muridarum str. Nigg]AHH22528.1 molecular chaperone GroEL [Chlamydia muridarum str. Nigg3 CMUT3-5]AHH23452.1 molecular chaperone GroEL [Chlamydia muridarum str. Nigg CM972]AID37679.1 molecular chaperone GroEL [Chlamydia muridarum str. Nigg 2 MCR]AIT90365.1 molecular chaperone GroEL [Chlamydia muridarum]